MPPCLAAWCLGIPVITHECDFSPGLATRINTHFARLILVSYAQTRSFFSDSLKQKIRVTGNPVRLRFYQADTQKGKAFIQYTGTKPILFVQGGSLGALALNTLIEQNAFFLTKYFFIVHQTGAQHKNHGDRIKQQLQELKPELAPFYHPFPFIAEQMPDVLAASDLVLSRAGANTIWEAAAAGKPMLLLPLQKGGSRGDQIENARFFTEQGAALTLDSQNVSESLCSAVTHFFDHPEKLQEMAQAAGSLAAEKPAVTIAHLLQHWVAS